MFLVAFFLADHLSVSVRRFFIKNLWWLSGLGFSLYAEQYTQETAAEIIVGVMGAFSGLFTSFAFKKD